MRRIHKRYKKPGVLGGILGFIFTYLATMGVLCLLAISLWNAGKGRTVTGAVRMEPEQNTRQANLIQAITRSTPEEETEIARDMIGVVETSPEGDGLDELYAAIPYPVKYDFQQNGWQVEIISAEHMQDNYSDGSGVVAGVTLYNEKAILLSDRSDHNAQALAHEMGHYFDYSCKERLNCGLGMPSQSEEFKKIFNEEALCTEGFEDYSISTQSEYFAEAFKVYCERPDLIINAHPKTYRYMKDLLERFSEALWTQ